MSRSPVTLVVKPKVSGLLGPVLPIPGQMTVDECIAEALQEPPRLSYVEPCPECAVGKCNNCDGRTLDHALDEIVPCPCRDAGHSEKSTA